jgi:hypothetical protein
VNSATRILFSFPLDTSRVSSLWGASRLSMHPLRQTIWCVAKRTLRGYQERRGLIVVISEESWKLNRLERLY